MPLDRSDPERALFPSTLPLVLSVVALVPPVGTIRLAYATGLLVAFDVSLGFNGVTYKHLYRWWLPIRGLRVPARMRIVLAISLAVLAAFGARRLLGRVRTAAGRTAVFGVLVVAAGADVWPSLELRRVWWQPPPVYDAVKGQSVVLAEFPSRVDISHITRDVSFMYFSIWHWLPIVNGDRRVARTSSRLQRTLGRSAGETVRARPCVRPVINEHGRYRNAVTSCVATRCPRWHEAHDGSPEGSSCSSSHREPWPSARSACFGVYEIGFRLGASGRH